MRGGVPLDIAYLDELFAAIRGATQQIAAAEAWIARAEGAPLPAWRLGFVAAARGAHEHAAGWLDEAERRLYALGTPASLPAPLDQLPQRLDAMRAGLRAQEERLLRAAGSATPGPLD